MLAIINETLFINIHINQTKNASYNSHTLNKIFILFFNPLVFCPSETLFSVSKKVKPKINKVINHQTQIVFLCVEYLVPLCSIRKPWINSLVK